MQNDLIAEWKKIAKQIAKYDKKYAYGVPLISDVSYDALRSKLQDIENIIGKQKNSPLNKIGEVEEKTVSHEIQMLSLDHGYGANSISDFYKKINNAIKNIDISKIDISNIDKSNNISKVIRESTTIDKYGIEKTENISKMTIQNDSIKLKNITNTSIERNNKLQNIHATTIEENGKSKLTIKTDLENNKSKNIPEMIIEHKIDGIAVSIRYKNGKLDYVLTRGDGFSGIDITQQANYISGIPKEFSIKDFEIRGEIYMTFKDFEKTTGFKNPRNATAGIIRNKEMSFIASHNLKFIAHGFVNLNNFSLYSDGINFIQKHGFEISKYYISKSEKESITIFENIDRDNIAYPIDGVVLKINNLEICEKLGTHRTAPRYAYAAKFPPKNAWTIIKKIEFQIGKFGTITPVAEVNPIEIDGISIKKVSMHNMLELKNKNYNIGDEIVLARAGDVIPYILQKKENDNPKKFKMPENCPECNSKLIWDSVTMKCPNGWNCKKQTLSRIEHFVSRKAMNINCLGGKNIEKLFDAKIIQKPNDIFKIIELVLNNDYMIKKLLGSKIAQNIYHSIQKNKEIKLDRLIYALCIPNVGSGIAKTISYHCKTFDNFISTFSQEKITIHGIGSVIIDSIKVFISQENWIFDLVKNLSIQNNE